MDLYDETIPVLTKFLANLEAWLDEAEADAKERGFDPEILVEARLAPDMFPLRRQVQAACDTAKFIAARLTGTEAPSHPDTEVDLAQLRARIAVTKEFLADFDREAFDGAEDRVLAVGFLPPDVRIGAAEYLRGFALPNFYFHLSVAYGILRHNGVTLGKRAYIGHLELVPASGE